MPHRYILQLVDCYARHEPHHSGLYALLQGSGAPFQLALCQPNQPSSQEELGNLLATELRYASENSSALSREASRTVKCAQIAETGTLSQLMKARGATFPRSRQPSPVELVQAPKERDIVREAVMRLAKGSTEVSGDRTLSR